MKRNVSLRWCRWFALVVLVAGGGLRGFAAPGPESSSTNALTLDQAVRLSLESNPELRALGARVQAAAGRAYQAKQWTNPELELNAEDWPVSTGRAVRRAAGDLGGLAAAGGSGGEPRLRSQVRDADVAPGRGMCG
jgi:hypothetical protein